MSKPINDCRATIMFLKLINESTMTFGKCFRGQKSIPNRETSFIVLVDQNK